MNSTPVPTNWCVRNELVKDASGDPGDYTGPLDSENGLPHGADGTMQYRDGRSYIGDWQKGKWHGHGKATFPNGDAYEGDYICDLRHGSGKYTWKDGRSYEGAFYNDARQGEGKYTWSDGTFYEGSFVKGQRHGNGTYEFDRGKYVGSFRTGQYSGYGECTWYDDGRSYKGEWDNGMAHGRGTERDANGRILHDGLWHCDEPVVARKTTDAAGLAPAPPRTKTDPSQSLTPVVNQVLKDARGRTGTFRGMVLRGTPHGVGHMIYASEKEPVATYQGFWDYGDWKQGRVDYRNGDVYSGEFDPSGRKSGTGEYHWADCRQYSGDWLDDKRHGQGDFHYQNGDYFHGQFVNGMRQGPGRFEFHDGSSFQGEFKKGQFHGHGCKYVQRDGRVYLGEFENGYRSGLGKELYPNNTLRYEGSWSNDEPDNAAKIQPAPPGFILMDNDDDDDGDAVTATPSQYSNASILLDTKDCTTVVEAPVKDAQGNSGTFTGLVNAANIPHGVGRMVYEGEIREGFWKEGYLEGHARAFFANGDYYDGIFCLSQRVGKGVYKWKDGRIYEGDYVADMRHGMGRFVYPSGDEYVGGYVKGMRSGNGKFSFADGSFYDGGWSNSLYQGRGELVEAGGNYYRGEWHEGKKHGKGVQGKNGLQVVGEWKVDELMEEFDEDGEEASEVMSVNEPSVAGDETSLATQEQVEPPPRASSFRWGSMDGETNRRWEPVETVTKELSNSNLTDESLERQAATPEDRGKDSELTQAEIS